MSGWTVATIRARHSKNYDFSRRDENDPSHALQDLCATAEADVRVRKWQSDSPSVFIYLNAGRYDFEAAEALLDDYSEMVRDAVVVGANDTSDTGVARYYENPDRAHTDEYQETQTEDGCHVGLMALQIIGARHGIIARDPFHGWVGEFDDRRSSKGEPRGVKQ